jgi:hypothetical protein
MPKRPPKPEPLGQGDSLPALRFWLALALLLLAQAWAKLALAPGEPFRDEQLRDWLGALSTLQSGHFPAYGPAMQGGPPIPGGWYYFILAQGARISQAPLALAGFITALYTAAAGFLAWRLSGAFNRAAALAVAALLSFHPLLIYQSAVILNSHVAFPLLMVALGALMRQRITFFYAALAGFCSVVAMHCHVVSVIALGAPLVWLLARWEGDEGWGFSWAGYALGLGLGGLGYIPWLLALGSQHGAPLSAVVQSRHRFHFDFAAQALKPIFFFCVQPGFEASSFFGNRWSGFVGYFRFKTLSDAWALLATYGSFLAALWLALLAWKGALSGPGSWRSRLLKPWGLALFRVIALTLPVWFLLAGRFDVKFAGLLWAWSYLPLAAWLALCWPAWGREQRLLFALAIGILCASGLSLHQRIFAQRGADLENARYSYQTVDAAALALAQRQPKVAAVVFGAGNGPTFTDRAIYGLAKERYRWQGSPCAACPVSSFEEKAYGRPGDWVVADGGPVKGMPTVWIGPETLSMQAQAAGGWRLLRFIDGMYLFANF